MYLNIFKIKSSSDAKITPSTTKKEGSLETPLEMSFGRLDLKNVRKERRKQMIDKVLKKRASE